MNEELLNRIEHILEEKNISATAASKAAGLGESFIRDLKRRGGSPTVENLEKLARVLDLSAHELLQSEIIPETEGGGLPLLGEIQAGQFKDITLYDRDEERPRIAVGRDSRYPRARQYALAVIGDSMDELFPDGCYVTCVDFYDAGLELTSGAVYHVERTIAGTHLVETTLKEVRVDKNGFTLIPRSTNKRHKPIPVKGNEDTEFEVKGMVLGSWVPFKNS